MNHKHLISQALVLSLIIVSGITFNACHDDEPEPLKTAKRLSAVLVKDCNIVKNEKGEIMPPVDYRIRFEYDEQNRLITYYEDYIEYSTVTTITYSPGEVSLEVDGRALGKYTLNSQGYAVKFERDFTKPCAYEYDAAGYLVKSDDGESVNTYEYKDGNLVSWSWGNTSGTFELSEIKDKMNGPAYYQPLRLYIKGYAEVLPAYMAGLFGKTPQYLPESGKRAFTLGEKTTTSTVNIAYTFDEDGYVTRQIETYLPGGVQGDMSFSYENYLIE